MRRKDLRKKDLRKRLVELMLKCCLLLITAGKVQGLYAEDGQQQRNVSSQSGEDANADNLKAISAGEQVEVVGKGFITDYQRLRHRLEAVGETANADYTGNADSANIVDNSTKADEDNNNNFSLRLANFSSTNGQGRHSCQRACQTNQPPLTCYYRLVVHTQQTVSAQEFEAGDCSSSRKQSSSGDSGRSACIWADGVSTTIMAINQMLPGPPIDVCLGDTLVVDIINYYNEPISMHWHGLTQLRTPEMDGAPYITQYPIRPTEAYRYRFQAERAGTLWYHSHVGLQRRALGVAGSFVIREAVQRDRQAYLYDYDFPQHTLMIQDYAYDNGNGGHVVRNLLINGKGRNHLTTLSDRDARHRYARLHVTNGKRYRMRVIYNGVFNCPIEFSVEQHRMLMIAADGNDIVPVLADSFFMAAGERFDFVLKADQQATRSYWIKVRGYEKCERENIYQGAILSYQAGGRKSANASTLPQRQTQPPAAERERKMSENLRCQQQVNNQEYVIVGDMHAQLKERQRINSLAEQQQQHHHNNAACAQRSNLKVSNVANVGLKALEPVPWTRDTQFLTHYSLLSGTQQTYPGSETGDATLNYKIDGITFASPKISLLQANGLFNELGVFCNRSLLLAQRGINCAMQSCICTNVIRLPAYSALELVLVNNNQEPHPVHLHGYTFRLVGQNILGGIVDLQKIKQLDQRGLLQRSSDDFPLEKDTVQVPPLGYAIIRFYSSNPGYWMYHSTLDTQAAWGMIGVFKIGEDHQIKDLPALVRC